MNSNRKIAMIVGVLFITATAAGVVGLVFLGSILDPPDYLTKVSANQNQVIIGGALFALIMVAANVGIAVMMFPILKKHNESIALGYFGAIIIYATAYVVGVISLLSLVTLSQEYVAGAPDASYFQTLGTSLLAVQDWAGLLGANIIFGLGALMFYYSLYQSKLIPRFLSVWGLIGATLMLAAGLLGMFALSPRSTIFIFLNLPIASNEMFLAVWLIVKGFSSSAIASESAKTDIN